MALAAHVEVTQEEQLARFLSNTKELATAAAPQQATPSHGAEQIGLRATNGAIATVPFRLASVRRSSVPLMDPVVTNALTSRV